jgi:hypothetical protein
MSLKTTIIIPAKNEADNIAKVIEGVKKYSFFNAEIIVVDNESRDRTSELSKEQGATVYQANISGKGEAMKIGAKKANGEILIFIDGDDSYPAESIPKLIEPILKEEKDIVYGSRFLGNLSREMGFFRKLGNKLFSLIARSIYRTKTTDLLTGFFAVKKEKFLELKLESKGFEIETEIFIKAHKLNLRRTEIPIKYFKKSGSKLNPLIDGFKILKTLFKNS